MRSFLNVVLVSTIGVSLLNSAFADDKSKSKQRETTVQNSITQDISKPISLEDAIKIGLSNHESLAIAQSQLESARARITQARASYFPQVAPQFQYSSNLSAFNVGGTSTRTTVEQAVTSIGLRQLIFDMGKREENVALSKKNATASEYQILDSRQAVIVNVTSSYYELLRRKELVKVAESSVDRTKTALEATRAFVQAGTSPKKDILQAEADFDNAQVQLSVAKNDVRIATTSLKNAMGLLTALPVTTPDNTLPKPTIEPDKMSSADYLKMAFDRRPDLKQQSAFIDASKHNVKIAQINSGFQIEADVTEGYRIDPNPGENRSFVTTFSYPLFDAGSTKAAVKQAKESLLQSKKQLDLTRQAIQLDVEQNYLTREESRLRITSTQTALRAAQENYNSAREAQKEGAGTIIDVITAQTQLVTAETNAVQAIYDFYISDARLRRAIGDNDPYLAGGKKP